MRKHIVGRESKQIFTIGLQLVTAVHLFFNADLPAWHTIVSQLRIDGDELRSEEPEFLLHIIADGENPVHEFHALEQRVLVEVALVPEGILHKMPLGHRGAHDVVKHRVMAGMFLDDPPHRRDFMRVEDRAEVAFVRLQNGGEAGGDAHVFMRKNHTRLQRAAGAQRMQRRHRRRGQPHVLLEVVDVLISRAFQAELAVTGIFEMIDLVLIESRYVDQQHFRG